MQQGAPLHARLPDFLGCHGATSIPARSTCRGSLGGCVRGTGICSRGRLVTAPMQRRHGDLGKTASQPREGGVRCLREAAQQDSRLQTEDLARARASIS